MQKIKIAFTLFAFIFALFLSNAYFLLEIYKREKKNLINSTNKSLFNSIETYKKIDLNRLNKIKDSSIISDANYTEKVSATNLILNSDFELGDSLFKSDYDKLPPQGVNVIPNYKGWYFVTNDARNHHGSWRGKGYNNENNFLLLDGASDSRWEAWSQIVKIRPKCDYIFKFYLASIAFSPKNTKYNSLWQLANLEITINNTPIGLAKAPDSLNYWIEHKFNWNSGKDSIAKIAIKDLNTVSSYNDFGLDKISFIEAYPNYSKIISTTKFLKKTPLKITNTNTTKEIDTTIILGIFANEMEYEDLDIDYKLMFFKNLKQFGKTNKDVFTFSYRRKQYDRYYDISEKCLASSLLPLESSYLTTCYLFNYKSYLLKEIQPYIMSSCFFVFVSFLFLYLGYRFSKKEEQITKLKYQLTNNITHELKTPVSIILAAIESLQQFKFLDDKAKTETYVEITRLQALRLNMLIDNVLKMAMVEDRDFRLLKSKISMNKVISSITKDNKNIGAEINLDLTEHDNIIGDMFHITNIISTIIENSIKYSNSNCRIDISSKRDEKYYTLSIKDNGIGILKKYHKLIFDKYYRVPTNDNHNVKGYGLGLSYVKIIMDLHKGSVVVKSDGIKGTEIILKFKLYV